jgi:hypothetical protein
MPLKKCVAALFFGALLFAQNSPSDLIVLPSAATEAAFSLLLPPQAGAVSGLKNLPVTDANGHRIWPRPVADRWTINGQTIQVSMSNIYFWGSARFPVGTGVDAPIVYSLHRGPSVTPAQAPAGPGQPAQLWLYNYESRSVPVSWRVLSGGAGGTAFEDKWEQVTLGPVSSQPIAFPVPSAWFSLNPTAVVQRSAQLQMRFGSESTAPVLSVPFTLLLHSDASVLVPPAIASTASAVWHIAVVTLGVTLGAVLLMLAQVMIPNFRQVLRMETQADGLQERLRAIGGQVGTRLYTRCQQELESFRFGLAMLQAAAQGRTLWWDRLVLSGNTAEVTRLSGILTKIETRIKLTERLDELQTAIGETELLSIPPTVCWNQRKQLLAVQSILSRQFITDADEKSASANLDGLADDSSWLKAFAGDLEARIAALRRQLAGCSSKSKGEEWMSGLNGCVELLKDPPAASPEGGWTIPELISRDLAAIRLEIICQMIELDGLLAAKDGSEQSLLQKLKSIHPSKLYKARLELMMIAEGVFEEDVRKALEAGMWDAYMEPAAVTNQDVVRASLVFRDKTLQRSTAKDAFLCEWGVSNATSGEDEVEQGWEIQLIPRGGKTVLTPDVYDAAGNKLQIRAAAKEKEKAKGEDDGPKGVLDFEVGQPAKNSLTQRLTRGTIDAVLTAIVPVVTVALTQFQNGGSLGLDKLVLIGFTSQAIRSAIIPETLSGSPDAQSVSGAARS